MGCGPAANLEQQPTIDQGVNSADQTMIRQGSNSTNQTMIGPGANQTKQTMLIQEATIAEKRTLVLTEYCPEGDLLSKATRFAKKLATLHDPEEHAQLIKDHTRSASW
ncbi:MAG: hypothetical protein ACRCXC_10625 [Legionella sp.]